MGHPLVGCTTAPIEGAARSRGRKGGHPRSLSDEDLKQVRALLTDPDITVEDIARRFGVGSSTLYRYLPAALQAAQDEA
jgi:transposase-like protein